MITRDFELKKTRSRKIRLESTQKTVELDGS